jgi:hypothetical protein
MQQKITSYSMERKCVYFRSSKGLARQKPIFDSLIRSGVLDGLDAGFLYKAIRSER